MMPDDPASVESSDAGIPDVLVKLDQALGKLDKILDAIDTPESEGQESGER